MWGGAVEGGEAVRDGCKAERCSEVQDQGAGSSPPALISQQCLRTAKVIGPAVVIALTIVLREVTEAPIPIAVSVGIDTAPRVDTSHPASCGDLRRARLPEADRLPGAPQVGSISGIVERAGDLVEVVPRGYVAAKGRRHYSTPNVSLTLPGSPGPMCASATRQFLPAQRVSWRKMPPRPAVSCDGRGRPGPGERHLSAEHQRRPAGVDRGPRSTTPGPCGCYDGS